jgi:hypothetical protein
MKGQYQQNLDWYSVAVWVGVVFLVYGNMAMADLLPGRRQLQILNQVKDCGIYQAVLRNAKADAAEENTQWKAVVAASVVSRKALEDCAKSHGIPQISTDREETVAAATCRDEYEAWAERATRIEMLKQDAQTSRGATERMEAFVRYQCSGFSLAKNP